VILMKKIIYLLVFAAILILYSKPTTASGEYIVIAWNDLGMHCSNKDFSTMAVLPPYNNLKAQVIKRGSGGTLPQIITTGVRVTYEIPGNTYSVGKTNFWDYAQKLFGVQLAPNIGLKGAGLTGEMTVEDNHYKVEGIPITPYQDTNLTKEDPYQLALVKIYDLDGNLLATASPVIPVSNEINCVGSGCHASEQQILNNHENEGGFDPNNKPILCASCHASNALGTTGISEAEPLSLRIHRKHAGLTSDCYKCHPGPNTKCLRGAMFGLGKKCTDCHGTLAEIANSISNGRRPWLDEPSCNNPACHIAKYATTNGALFRLSKDHGNLFCSACHGSPHAEYPSTNPRDNQQMIDLQGYPGKLIECWVCHGETPAGNGPHGYHPETKVNEENNYHQIRFYPNPVYDVIYIQKPNSGDKVEFYTMNGAKVSVGSYNNSTGVTEEKYNLSALPKGTYICKIGNASVKFVKI
jgi:hypothetical protein